MTSTSTSAVSLYGHHLKQGCVLLDVPKNKGFPIKLSLRPPPHDKYTLTSKIAPSGLLRFANLAACCHHRPKTLLRRASSSSLARGASLASMLHPPRPPDVPSVDALPSPACPSPVAEAPLPHRRPPCRDTLPPSVFSSLVGVTTSSCLSVLSNA